MLNTTPARPTAPTPIAAFSASPDRWRVRSITPSGAAAPARRPAVTLEDHVAFLLGRDDDGVAPADRELDDVGKVAR